MRSASSSRRSGPQGTALLVLLGISVLGHAAVVATVNISTPSVSNAMLASLVPTAQCKGAACAGAELQPSCEADAALAMTARLGVCASPFGPGGSRTCSKDAVKQLELDLIRCHRDPDAVAVELIDLSDIDVTPRPLLPDVKPVDDIVAAQLIEQQVADKLEQAQKEAQRPDPSGQVVEITRPQVEMAPDRARYLSEFDSRTDKQTVARGSTEKMVERPAPKQLPPTTQTNPEELKQQQETKRDTQPSNSGKEGPGRGREDSKQPNIMSMRGVGQATETPAETPTKLGAKNGQKIATADGIAPRWGEKKTWSKTTETQPVGGGEQGGGAGPKAPNLRPTPELIERAVGGGSVDNIDDADDGDITSLNSRKWKYATFFNRMKRQVAQNWHPDVVYLRRDPNGNIYGTRDRLTVLRVSLNPNGSVAKIYVAKQSGVDFLDDEAVRAFQEAQPFPNPPAGLVDARSNLITFSFGFHFQIGGDRSRWKVFRYQ